MWAAYERLDYLVSLMSSLKEVPGTNFGFFVPGMRIDSPVEGLRPGRGAQSTALKGPKRYGFTAAHGRNDFFEGAHDNAVNLGFRGRIAGGDAVYEFKTVHKNPCVKAMFLYCSA